ncbi:hypothetical protein Poli38472_009316 [Pythium oligandrum]|uniref:Uncharacterized protein n=1 Tax=Pythium oligandrum TaxID=41045 RepID=A0A8K1CLA5_PYTOL|nr:hypothetical protein Poli38472_009316 [Pythium oligandrum]|eukprot:TMW65149.1 hypothetical protein Poli38472_009316 [Pythium oligandrum]
MFVAVVAIDTFAGTPHFPSYERHHQHTSTQVIDSHSIPFLVLSIGAAIGIQISWLASLALSVELQREQLRHRGQLQAILIFFYYIGSMAAHAFTAIVFTYSGESSHVASKFTISTAGIVLAGLSAMAIGAVFWCVHASPFVDTSSVRSIKKQHREFWHFCHQNVVYRVLFFISGHVFLVSFSSQDVRECVRQWSGVSRKDSLFIEISRTASMVLSVFLWQHYLVNVSWRKLAVLGSISFLGCGFIVTLVTTLNWYRAEWFYGTIVSIGDLPRAWLVLYAVILSTELADIGREGVTLGLAMSFQSMSSLAGSSVAGIFGNLLGMKTTKTEIAADTSATRHKVLLAYGISLAINLTSFALIGLLPHQKLDAQQLRAFGGYNRYASFALLLLLAVLLVFNLAINLAVVL